MFILEAIVVGAFVGFSIGLTGVGGGALITPAMILILDVEAAAAVGTAFLFALVVKLVGFVRHRSQGTVNKAVALHLLLGSVPLTIVGAVLTAVLLDRYGESVNDWLKLVMGLVLVVAAAAAFWEGQLRVKRAHTNPHRFTRQQELGGVAIGAGMGMAVGTTSIGAASLVVMPLILLYRLEAAEVVGTSIAISVVLTAVGGAAFAISGNIEPKVALYMCAGAIPAVILGSNMTLRLPERVLKALILVAVLGAAVAVLISSAGDLAGE